MKTKALKEQNKASRPTKALTVYPPNTPATLVPRVLPTKSQVKINIFTLIQLFSEFEKTYKKRITPTGLTEGERCFEQTKECYLTEVIPFFKTLKEYFEGIQKALTKEIKQMKEIFKEVEAEKCFILQQILSLLYLDSLKCMMPTVVQARCLELEAELSKLNDKIQKDDHNELVKRFSNLEITRAKHIEQTTTLLTENENLKAQIHENMKCITIDSVKPRVLAPSSVETLREIVEEAKVERPLDRSLESACLYTKHYQELLEYVIGTCLKDFNNQDKKHVSTPLTRKKQVTFEDQCETSNNNTYKHVEQLNIQKTNVHVIPSTGVNSCTDASGSKPMSNTKKNRIWPAKSVNKKKVEEHPRTNKSSLKNTNRVDSSISSKRTVINLNSHYVCKTCNKCLIFENHDMCVVNYLHSVNASPYVKNVVCKVKKVWKPKQVKQVWKTTRKVLTNVGYQWKPMGRILTLGEQCPLTRLTKSNVLPVQQTENVSTSKTIITKKLSNTSQKLLTSYQRRNKQYKAIPTSIPTLTMNQAIDTSMQTDVVQIVPWYLDSGYSKHMTGDRLRLRNFMKKFIVRFGNDHFGAIMGYGDYVIGDSAISKVYYMEGMGHNMFSIEQYCDSNLEVAFRKHSCYVRDTDRVELIKGSHGSNLYTISVEDMMKSSLICLLSTASKNKSWLWHRCLNHLNFDTINDLARKDLVRGLHRLKFEKDHLCSVCKLGKSKKHTHTPKTENTNLEVLNTLYMDLCGPMRVQTINGKKYISVIVDDYSSVGIFHQKSVPRTPQQNGVVERRNRTLVEAARTMLIFFKALMFLWAEVVATACYTQN
ncbi:retrovirus-related pol polyprotein from transposon TNT 1-94 [Tanacetum coccineum]